MNLKTRIARHPTQTFWQSLGSQLVIVRSRHPKRSVLMFVKTMTWTVTFKEVSIFFLDCTRWGLSIATLCAGACIAAGDLRRCSGMFDCSMCAECLEEPPDHVGLMFGCHLSLVSAVSINWIHPSSCGFTHRVSWNLEHMRQASRRNR